MNFFVTILRILQYICIRGINIRNYNIQITQNN